MAKRKKNKMEEKEVLTEKREQNKPKKRGHKKFNVKKETITFWASPAHKKRVKNKGKVAIRIDDE